MRRGEQRVEPMRAFSGSAESQAAWIITFLTDLENFISSAVMVLGFFSVVVARPPYKGKGWFDSSGTTMGRTEAKTLCLLTSSLLN